MHLFHPALVHFTVAFVVVGGLAEAWGRLAGRERVSRWGESLLLWGSVSLVPTLASGYLASNNVSVSPAGQALMNAHERNGWIVFALLLAAQFWKAWAGAELPVGQSRAYAAFLLVAVAFAVYSAWLGGQMVYAHGIGVR